MDIEKEKGDFIGENETLSYFRELSNVYNSAPFAIELYDKTGALLDANQAALDIFGIKRKADILPFNLFSEPHLSAENLLEIQSGKKIQFELMYDFDAIREQHIYPTVRTGIAYIECQISPILTSNSNNINGYIVYISDISHLRNTESSFREKEEIHEILLDLAPDAFFSGDSKGNFLSVNKSAIELTEYSKDELRRMNIKDLFTEESLNEKPLRYNLLKEGYTINTERELKTKSGKSVLIEMHSRRMPDGTYQSFFRDITQRKMAEYSLQQSEEKFRSIVENSPRGMYFLEIDSDRNLILKGANEAADRISGIDHQSMIGKPVEEAFPNIAGTTVAELYKDIASGVSGPVHFDLDYSDLRVAGVYDVHAFSSGKNKLTINFADITAKKEAEATLAKQARELQEINLIKDKFLSIIAHDLKSPFNAILGFSDLLLKNFHQLDEDTLLKGLRTIESASVHANKLLENLLIWARNQSGRIEFKPERIDLRGIIEESAGALEGAASKKNIRLIIGVKKGINIYADKNMAATIIRNLISNAIKFSHKGGAIKITAETDDRQVLVSVEDNGVGIRREKLAEIFEIDKRTCTLGTENEQGSGLGLILCKEFITRHQGKIWAESTPGIGSTFKFSIPLN